MNYKTGFALAAAATLALTSCTSPSTPTSGTPASAAPANMRVWINGSDTPKEAREWLKTTFETQNPGSTLTIEEQQWTGLVEKLTTALSSEAQTPDVVEVGNTQAPTFTTVGAFSDVTTDLPAWGGSDLLKGFVDAGSVDGKTYAVPYYAGSKYVFYRKDMFAAAGVKVPTTLTEFVDAAVQLKKANADKPNFSGFWLPGKDWRNAVTFIWAKGGDLAVDEGGTWKGSLSSPKSQEGLKIVQQLFKDASGAAKDGAETDAQVPFCHDEVAMLSAPGWVKGLISDASKGCPDKLAQVGVFALPGDDGKPAPVLLGGSDIAVAAKSKNQVLAKKIVALMLSKEYQSILAKNGLTPALTSLSGQLGSDEYAAATIAAATNAKLTPATAGWASVEGAKILEDFTVGIATGGDLTALASATDAKLTEQLKK